MAGSSAYNRTVVDNWLLELAFRVLDKSLDDTYSGIDSYRSYYDRHATENNQVAFRRDKLIALFHLLDILILSDQLICDAGYSPLWITSQIWKPLKPYLVTAELDEEQWSNLKRLSKFDAYNDIPEIIKEGAFYYGSSGFPGVASRCSSLACTGDWCDDVPHP